MCRGCLACCMRPLCLCTDATAAAPRWVNSERETTGGEVSRGGAWRPRGCAIDSSRRVACSRPGQRPMAPGRPPFAAHHATHRHRRAGRKAEKEGGRGPPRFLDYRRALGRRVMSDRAELFVRGSVSGLELSDWSDVRLVIEGRSGRQCFSFLKRTIRALLPSSVGLDYFLFTFFL
jgi:hypothetical protein